MAVERIKKRLNVPPNRRLLYGDRRVSPVCRAAALALLLSKQQAGPVQQTGKDTFICLNTDLLRIKSSNTAHLAKEQFFWGAISAEQVHKFLQQAERRKLSPYYALVAPSSARLTREEWRDREPDDVTEIPDSADVWQIPARAVADFLQGKKTTRSGFVHVWVLRREDRFLLCDQAYAPAEEALDVTQWHGTVSIPDHLKTRVAAGKGVWLARTAPARQQRPGVKQLLRELPQIDVNLRVGQFRVTGTLTVRLRRQKKLNGKKNLIAAQKQRRGRRRRNRAL